MEDIRKIFRLEDFLKGIEAKKDYPKGLQLNVVYKQIGVEGIKALARALHSGQCPQGLQLILEANELGDEGAKVLAIALQSGQCPQGLQLNVSDNEIGVEGAKALAMALQSGQCPLELQLYLEDNKLGDEGAKALATALQSGQCPQGFKLSLSGNEIDTEGVTALAMALQSGQCPQGLQLDIIGNQLGDEDIKTIKEAWAVYYARQQDNFINCMTLYQGHGQIASPINRLPQELLQEICRHVLPATPILAKMTELSAKAFLQRKTLSTNAWDKIATSIKAAGNFLLKAFHQQYVSLETSIQMTPANEKELDNAIAKALAEKTLAKRVASIEKATEIFLAKELELGTHETKKYIKSPTVALLCKYHMLARNCVHQDPNQPDYFHLNEQAKKKSIF